LRAAGVRRLGFFESEFHDIRKPISLNQLLWLQLYYCTTDGGTKLGGTIK
jgi:hypothetical protein